MDRTSMLRLPDQLIHAPLWQQMGDLVVSVSDLLESVGLRLRGGQAGSEATVRWGHISELPDPTPWIKGGEMLLTTGLGIPEGSYGRRQYCDRLSAAGVIALGLGVGFRFDELPCSFLAAADDLGLPMFEVPYDMPFMVITEALSQAIAHEEYRDLECVVDSQQRLTRIVLRGSNVLEGLVDALAEFLPGWTVIIDGSGSRIVAASDVPDGVTENIKSEVRTLHETKRSQTMGVSKGGSATGILAITGESGVPYGYLAFGKEGPLARYDRFLATHAYGLISSEIMKAFAVAETERRLEGGLVESIAKGELTKSKTRQQLMRHGFTEQGGVRAVALQFTTSPGGSRALDEASVRLGALCILGEVGGVWIMLFAADEAPTSTELRQQLDDGTHAVRLGRGEPLGLGEASQSILQARIALRAAELDDIPQVDFGSLGWTRLLLELQDQATLKTFVDSSLSVLQTHDAEYGTDLIRSLSAYLEHNGRWDAAARELQVHRHTVRNRIEKVEELTGRNLGTAQVRTELWLAIRALDVWGAAATTSVADT